ALVCVEGLPDWPADDRQAAKLRHAHPLGAPGVNERLTIGTHQSRTEEKSPPKRIRGHRERRSTQRSQSDSTWPAEPLGRGRATGQMIRIQAGPLTHLAYILILSPAAAAVRRRVESVRDLCESPVTLRIPSSPCPPFLRGDVLRDRCGFEVAGRSESQ